MHNPRNRKRRRTPPPLPIRGLATPDVEQGVNVGMCCNELFTTYLLLNYEKSHTLVVGLTTYTKLWMDGG
jgi:hypothetical protein